MVICRRFLGMTVLSAMVIHCTSDSVHRNTISLSFVAVERLNEVAVDKSGTEVRY